MGGIRENLDSRRCLRALDLCAAVEIGAAEQETQGVARPLVAGGDDGRGMT